jgi:hypothetical protein
LHDAKHGRTRERVDPPPAQLEDRVKVGPRGNPLLLRQKARPAKLSAGQPFGRDSRKGGIIRILTLA